MSFGSSNPATTTTNTVQSLPAWLEPHAQAVAGQAGSLYNAGVGPEYFPGQTFLNFNPTQQFAFDQTLQAAGQDPLPQGAIDTTYDIMNRMGVTDAGWGAMQGVNDVASGYTRITTPEAYAQFLGQIPQYGLAQGTLNTIPWMNNIASGANGITTGSQYQGLLGQIPQNGLAQGTAPSLATMLGIGTGANGITTGGQFGNVYGSLLDPSVASQYLSNFAQTGGGPTASLSNLSGIASGQNPLGTQSLFSQIYGNAFNPSFSSQYLSGVAQGGAPTASQTNLGGIAQGTQGITTGERYAGLDDSISGGNPYFQQRLQDQLDRVSDQANAQFSLAGRYGSGAHTGTLADRLGEVTTAALSDQYNRDIQNRMGAIAGLTGTQAQNLQSRLAASGQIDSATAQRIAQQIGAAGQMDTARLGFGQQQLGAAQGLTGVQQQDLANRITSTGQIDQATAQRIAQQISATGQIDQARLGLSAAQMQALQGVTGVQGQNIANQLGASGQLFNALQGAQNQGFTQSLQGLLGLTNTQAQNLQNQMTGTQYLGNLYQGADAQRAQQIMATLSGLTGAQGQNIQNMANSGLQLANFFQGAQDDAFKAALGAGTISNAQYDPMQRIAGVGDAYNQLLQQSLNEEMARWEFANRQPWSQLGMYAQMLQGINAGGTTSSATTKPGPTLAQSFLGPAALGAGIGNMIMPGFGTAIGGLGGGLLGLMGS